MRRTRRRSWVISLRIAPNTGRNAAKKVSTMPARKAMPAELAKADPSKPAANGLSAASAWRPLLATSASTPTSTPSADPITASKTEVMAMMPEIWRGVAPRVRSRPNSRRWASANNSAVNLDRYAASATPGKPRKINRILAVNTSDRALLNAFETLSNTLI